MAKRARRVGVHEAKTHLSSLLRDAEKGTDIIIERAGRPVARIVPVTSVRSPAESYGMFAGQFSLGDDFDADSEELADLFGVGR